MVCGMEMGYLVDFQKALGQRDAPALLRLWEEYFSSETVDAKDFKSIMEAIKHSDLADTVGRYIEKAIPLWQTLEESFDADEVLRFILDLQHSNNLQLRELAQQFLDKRFGSDSLHQEKMRLVGLRGQCESFRGAISNYLLLNYMQKGNFVFHKGGWGVGEVIDISMVREQVIFEFDYVPGKKELSFKSCFASLTPLPNEHFLAMRFGSPDAIEKRARENAAEVIRMLLRDLGPKTALEIKDELCGLVISEKEWNRWWQNARAKLKKDKRIESPTTLKLPFKLLKEEVAHEEKLAKALDNNPDTDQLIQLIFSFFKDFPETLKNIEFKQTVKQKILETLSLPDISRAQELQFRFLLQDFGEEQAVQEILKGETSPQDLIREIFIQGLKKRLLCEVRKVLPNWQEYFVSLLLIVEQSTLRDFILSELLGTEAEEAVKKQLEELCMYPTKHPEAFLWYFQKVIPTLTISLGDIRKQSSLFESFLTLLGSTNQRDLIKKMHDILTSDRYAIVRQIMKNATEKEVQEFLLLVTKCHSLSDHDIKILHSLAEVAHPSLAKKNKRRGLAQPEEEVIWTTKEGYNALQKRIEQIGTVDTVENAKEIEIARAHGDLRENAEFKAALERRDRLQAELKIFSAQLNQCRVLTKEDVDTSRVGVGVVVECQSESGDTLSYTLLGPWDADPDHNILSFQSKLAQNMTGLKVGNIFELQGKKLQITAIRSVL